MKLIHKSYKFRITPDKKQIELLSKHFGACRFVFNRYLNSRKETYLEEKKSLNYYDNANDLTKLKKEGLKILSGCGMQSDTKQKRSKALPLGESMTSEAQPIASGVGG